MERDEVSAAEDRTRNTMLPLCERMQADYRNTVSAATALRREHGDLAHERLAAKMAFS
jgi:hypothetical protein